MTSRTPTEGGAVLRYLNRPNREYLSQGMADAPNTRLSSLRRVTFGRRLGAQSTMERRILCPPEELGVEWVLDGSVQKADKRIRLTVQLVHVSDGVPEWAEIRWEVHRSSGGRLNL
jgi:TolB-like protein